jgi:hypothetical protein
MIALSGECCCVSGDLQPSCAPICCSCPLNGTSPSPFSCTSSGHSRGEAQVLESTLRVAAWRHNVPLPPCALDLTSKPGGERYWEQTGCCVPSSFVDTAFHCSVVLRTSQFHVLPHLFITPPLCPSFRSSSPPWPPPTSLDCLPVLPSLPPCLTPRLLCPGDDCAAPAVPHPVAAGAAPRRAPGPPACCLALCALCGCEQAPGPRHPGRPAGPAPLLCTQEGDQGETRLHESRCVALSGRRAQWVP